MGAAEDQEILGNLEMVSVRYPGAELEREGTGWSGSEPAVVVSGLPKVNPGACGPEGALLGPQSPPSGRVGAGRQPGPRASCTVTARPDFGSDPAAPRPPQTVL